MIHSLSGGGAERLMAQLANRWHDQGHHVTLITWSLPESDIYPVYSGVRRVGLEMLQESRSLFHGIWANLKRVRALRKAITRAEPEWVLSFADQMNIVGAEAMRGINVPMWIAEHSHPKYQRLSPMWEHWRSRSYPRVTGCVALTSGIAGYMQRWVAADRLRVIPPAISPPSAGQIHSARTKTLLTVGRLSKEKNQLLLLDAWARCSQDLPDWTLRIVGDGPERDNLKHRAKSLQRVEFAGWVDDPWQEYQTAGLFVLTSQYEGFPVAMLEAMSQGVPCITTDCTDAVRELGVDCGVSVIGESPTASQLAEAMVELAKSETRREAMAVAARETALAYDWSQIGPLWDSVLAEST
ncbi:MAG TPA: hypothetical protein DDW52_17485 [Planctomycetaceae bacterium]|nr:hypothetical protein [Planctomycetaceae bacterium]